MLIKQIFGAAAAQLIACPLGSGSAKSCPIGVGSFRRLFTLAPLLKSPEVDHVSHLGPLSGRRGIRGTFTNA